MIPSRLTPARLRRHVLEEALWTGGAATLVGSLSSNTFRDIAVGPVSQGDIQFTLTVNASSVTPGTEQ